MQWTYSKPGRGLDKEETLVIVLGYFLFFLHKNIYCVYSISNEYPKHIFLLRTNKNYPRIIIKYSSLTIPLYGKQIMHWIIWVTITKLLTVEVLDMRWYPPEHTNIERGNSRGQYWYSVVDINVISNTSIVNNCFIIYMLFVCLFSW